MPLTPTPRQADFLGLTCEEALFGGAAGSGKSEMLLMWLAEGIDKPGYSAIIFRRTYPQLSRSNDSLIAKSHRLYQPLGGRYTDKRWTFPSGALIEFGHLQHGDSIYDYQGPSFHRIAFDELTQFTEDQYLYLFSRIRRTLGFPITMGMRASANPGGEGHLWVKARFITEDALEQLRGMSIETPTPAGLVFWSSPDRAYVPARIADNPYLDRHDYARKLGNLPPVTRERLMNGDWSIMPDGLIKSEWLRFYTIHSGEYLQLRDKEGRVFILCHQSECTRFMTIDTAGSSKDKTKEAKGKPHSFNVAAVWDRLPMKYGGPWLVLRDLWRERVDFPGLCAAVRSLQSKWHCPRLLVEDATMGGPLRDVLQSEMPIQTVSTGGKDKVTRAAPLLNMMQRGQVFLPQYENEWRGPLEAEWLSWQGQDDEPADQVDVAAYAAIECTANGGGLITLAVDPRKPIVGGAARGIGGVGMSGGGGMRGASGGVRMF